MELLFIRDTFCGFKMLKLSGADPVGESSTPPLFAKIFEIHREF
jgi:hypothetical protein